MMSRGDHLLWLASISGLAFVSVSLLVYSFWGRFRAWLQSQERRYATVLNKQLLLEISPRLAMILTGVVILGLGIFLGLLLKSWLWFAAGAGVAMLVPHLVINHLAQKRRDKLEAQITDGVTTLSSGARAGLTLVQSFQLMVTNTTGPIQQEFQEMTREYELGVDLNQAMLNTSDRIGSSYYRLLFAAVQAHRTRGGDMAQSLDRIGESIREIQRLEGRLKSLTAQGRAQARFMGVMPLVVLAVWAGIFPEATQLLFTEPFGRLVLLFAAGIIVLALLWIRRIMQVDI